MPEGDTVRRTADRLQRALAGSELTRSDFRVPALATCDLRGRRILESTSRGKHLLLRLSGGQTLHTHLRMEGSWRLFQAGRRWGGGPEWQVRVALATARWQAVGYRLPVVELLRTADEHNAVGHLGPDLLRPEPPTGEAAPRRHPLTSDYWDPGEALRRLSADPDRPIISALLDQRNIAGIGNMWAGETCFLRGAYPWRAVGDVDLPGMLRLARRMMRQAADTGMQVTTGDQRRGQTHWVYGRAGQPCRRCAVPIQFRQAVPGEPYLRETWWCPACQPATT